MHLSTPKQHVLDQLVSRLSRIEGVEAIVLGGSHATGMATESSDLDIGLYYQADRPFAIASIRELALETDPEATVTDFYGWGPWVNGGAWLTTAAGEVDFLYRNIDQVRDTIEKAKNGNWEQDYAQQPPYGFSSVIYLAETRVCLPLFDPGGLITQLKKEVEEYPPALRQTIVQQGLWAAEFSLWQADKFATAGDLYNTAGCITRSLKQLAEVLCALAGHYPTGDKHVWRELSQRAAIPVSMQYEIDAILLLQRDNLLFNTRALRMLLEQVREKAGSLYRPYFVL